MIRQTPFYRILSAIHIVFFSSLLCFTTICLSGTILFLPAVGASFLIGKDAIYKSLDINDSIIKTYFAYLKSSMKLVKFFSVNIIVALNIMCMITMANSDHFTYSVVCLVISALLLSFMLYIAGYHTFVNEKIKLTEVFISMFTKVHLLIMVFIIMILCVIFFSGTLATIFALCGTLIVFVLEIPIFIQMMHLLNLFGRLDSDDQFAYLVNIK